MIPGSVGGYIGSASDVLWSNGIFPNYHIVSICFYTFAALPDWFSLNKHAENDST